MPLATRVPRALRLLRQVDQFLACDDDELAALAHAIEERQVLAGALLLGPGEPAAGVWVVEAGEVTVVRNGMLAAELHRGDAFGAEELDAGTPSTTTYRAAIASDLLFIPAAEFGTFALRAANSRRRRTTQQRG